MYQLCNQKSVLYGTNQVTMLPENEKKFADHVPVVWIEFIYNLQFQYMLIPWILNKSRKYYILYIQ
jgi:hypothetical protein